MIIYLYFSLTFSSPPHELLFCFFLFEAVVEHISRDLGDGGVELLEDGWENEDDDDLLCSDSQPLISTSQRHSHNTDGSDDSSILT